MASPKLFPPTLLVGGAAAVATAVTAPQFVGAPLTFIGGALAGLSIAERKDNKHLENKNTASRVSGAFSALYERNRGLIDPVELSFVANVDLEKAYSFLEALAESTGATKVNNNQGVGASFNFPHTANVLEELSSNAQNWSNQQTAALNVQLEQHKMALRAAQLAQVTQPQQTVQPVKNEDFWNNQ